MSDDVIDSPFEDEFGQIVPEIYTAAQSLRSQALSFAYARGYDEWIGEQQLGKAAAIVSRSDDFREGRIENLAGYVYIVYRQLIRDLSRRDQHRRDLEQENQAEIGAVHSGGLGSIDLDRLILLQEIVTRVRSGQVAEIFEYVLLGNTYNEIGEILGEAPDTIRRRMEREVKRITKELQRKGKGPRDAPKNNVRSRASRLLKIIEERFF